MSSSTDESSGRGPQRVASDAILAVFGLAPHDIHTKTVDAVVSTMSELGIVEHTDVSYQYGTVTIVIPSSLYLLVEASHDQIVESISAVTPDADDVPEIRLVRQWS